MAETASTMLTLGASAPPFSLPDIDGQIVSLDDFAESPVLVVIFACNHCPYVIHVLDVLVKLIKEYQAQGVAVATINANDVEHYPQDRPEMMARLAQEKDFTFPYLFDETQNTAKRYQAACTPDFFVFDQERKLIYRGQMDDSRPGNNKPITGADLTAAIESALAGKEVTADQKPSMGCNIKWKPHNEPDYFL